MIHICIALAIHDQRFATLLFVGNIHIVVEAIPESLAVAPARSIPDQRVVVACTVARQNYDEAWSPARVQNSFPRRLGAL